VQHNISSTATQTDTTRSGLENFLLRSVFRTDQNHTESSHGNLSIHFEEALRTIYEQALEKQKQEISNRMRRHLLVSTNNSSINVTIWDLQVDDSLKTIDVIYYLQKDGVLLPYEDALKVMSFASKDYIYNQTGYDVIHKVKRKLYININSVNLIYLP